MKILIVDDQDAILRIIKGLLAELGYNDIRTASNGQKACVILKQEKIEMIISDWNMPQMTGIELLKFIRQDTPLANIPFIMVTAEAEKDNIVEAIQAGVDQYVVKPFSADDLKKKMDLALKKRTKH